MTLADVSVLAIPIVLCCVAVAAGTALLLGRALGVDVTMRRLLAAGTAICGCTAIIASAPLFRARKADVGIAMTCVVLFGSIAMMGYPWIAAALFGEDVRAAGMFFGAAIHDTSQVIGAALIYSDTQHAPQAVAIAGLTKFLRTLGLLLLVPLAAWIAAREHAPAAGTPGLRKKAVPVFVIGFIVLVILRSLGDAIAGGPLLDAGRWKEILDAVQLASEWLLLVGMAAVGLGVTFAHLREAGWRPIALALAAAILTGACALAGCLLAASTPTAEAPEGGQQRAQRHAREDDHDQRKVRLPQEQADADRIEVLQGEQQQQRAEHDRHPESKSQLHALPPLPRALPVTAQPASTSAAVSPVTTISTRRSRAQFRCQPALRFMAPQ
jgi:uncharacterized integral membrane protein (TIGR00698 family)